MAEKARRGELIRLLPPGYVCDALGKVFKDPDERVREAIASVFRKFREVWSIRNRGSSGPPGRRPRRTGSAPRFPPRPQ